MKFKLDENFGTRTQELFRAAGYEVNTVRDENLQGTSDQNLFEICCKEKHCLVTLDSDFSNPIHFPPDQLSGIVVIRVPQNPSLELLEELIESFLTFLHEIHWEKQLLIVQPGRIRIYQPEKD